MRPAFYTFHHIWVFPIRYTPEEDGTGCQTGIGCRVWAKSPAKAKRRAQKLLKTKKVQLVEGAACKTPTPT